MEIFEEISGARMHTALYRPIYKNKTLKKPLFKKILFFLKNLPVSLNEINSLLLNNKIWKSRLQNIGFISQDDIKNFNLSGVLARSANKPIDLRIIPSAKYGFYKYIKINSFLSKTSDSYNRYVLRILEMFESINIVTKINISALPGFSKKYVYMESTINDFYLWSGLLKTIPNPTHGFIESGKGSFGVWLNINNKSRINNIKISSPSYNHLFWLTQKTHNLLLADLITLIGTIDIVFGEIDRSMFKPYFRNNFKIKNFIFNF